MEKIDLLDDRLEELENQNTNVINDDNSISSSHSSSSTKKEPQESSFMIFAFFFFGFSSLLPWNSVLACLHFFRYFHSSWSVSIIYPFMYFATSILFQFLLIVFNKNTLKYHLKIEFSLISFIVLLCLYPIIVLYTSQTVGFILMCIAMLYTGFVSAICSSSFYGLMGYFPMKCIITYSAGCSYVGLLMNIIRYISLYSFTLKDEESNIINTSLLFFLISAIIMIICLLLFIVTYKKKDFIIILSKVGEITPHSKIQDSPLDGNNIPDKREGISLTTFVQGVKVILSINILTATIYIVHFMFYPSSLIFLSFFSNTIQAIFNISEIIGRNIPYFINPKKYKLYIVTILRFICIVLIPLLVFLEKNKIRNDIYLSSFVLIAILLFMGITTGLGTSLAFALAPMHAPNELKGAAIKCVGFFLILGIFLGNCIAFGVEPLMKFIPLKPNDIID